MSEEMDFRYNPAGRLQDRVAFVSGAGSVGPGWGNGRAIAVRFAEEGALVFATDRDPARLVETAERVAAAGGTLAATFSVRVSGKVKWDAAPEGGGA